MKFLFPKEQLLLEMAAKNNPKLQEAVGKIFIHLPEKLFHERYEPKMVEEFLKVLVQESQKQGTEQYFAHVTEDDTIHTILKRCIAPDKLQDNLVKSLGSGGLTKLIEEILEKMSEATGRARRLNEGVLKSRTTEVKDELYKAGKSDFGSKEIKNLVTLIEVRNKLRQAEEIFLEKTFRRYLQKQISLYD